MRRFLASGFHRMMAAAGRKPPSGLVAPDGIPAPGPLLRLAPYNIRSRFRTAAGHLRHDGQVTPPLADPVGLRTSNAMISRCSRWKQRFVSCLVPLMEWTAAPPTPRAKERHRKKCDGPRRFT